MGGGAGDAVAGGMEVTGSVPSGFGGVAAQPIVMKNTISMRETQTVLKDNVAMDILFHPVSIVDYFSTCLIINITSLA